MSEIQTVHVAVSGTSFSFDQPFTYRIPLHMQGENLTGKRIVVPFGKNNSKRIGLVLDMHKKDADDAAKFAKEKFDYIGRMQKELETVMNTPVSEETEEDLKKNFEHGQQAILAEQAAEALNQGKE